MDVTRDGAEALDYLYRRGAHAGRESPSPVLVLLDLKMPRLDGLDVLRQVRRDPLPRTMPVVVLTSSREAPDISNCYELGANAYVVKPVKFEDFVKGGEPAWFVLDTDQPAAAFCDLKRSRSL